jgi:hypothetical protein
MLVDVAFELEAKTLPKSRVPKARHIYRESVSQAEERKERVSFEFVRPNDGVCSCRFCRRLLTDEQRQCHLCPGSAEVAFAALDALHFLRGPHDWSI